jgi:hypothetical protein
MDEPPVAADAPTMRFPQGPPIDLAQAARNFFHFPSPYVYMTMGAGAWIARIVMGGWTWRDPLLAAIVIALWPLQEWLLHVFILHFKPKVVFGRRIDLLAGRKHRAHHREPGRPGLIFIPLEIALASVIVLPTAWLLPLKLPLGLTGLATYYTFALRYEWTHFLIHSTHPPRARRFKKLWLNHRYHHYRNEHFWFGVSMTLGDKILRTAPDPRTTPVSPTCMTLGVEAELSEAMTP